MSCSSPVLRTSTASADRSSPLRSLSARRSATARSRTDRLGSWWDRRVKPFASSTLLESSATTSCCCEPLCSQVLASRCYPRASHTQTSRTGSSNAFYPSGALRRGDRKSTRLNSSHSQISYAVFCLKKKKKKLTPSLNKKKKTIQH